MDNIKLFEIDSHYVAYAVKARALDGPVGTVGHRGQWAGFPRPRRPVPAGRN